MARTERATGNIDRANYPLEQEGIIVGKTFRRQGNHPKGGDVCHSEKDRNKTDM